MARVTVEDCVDKIPNRFEMVLSASHRARQLYAGADAHLEWDNDKPTVMALREIAEGFITEEVLNEPENQSMASLGEGLMEDDMATPTTSTLGSY